VAPSTRSSACADFEGDGGLVESYGDQCLSVVATYDSCRAFVVPDGGAGAPCYACLVTPYDPDAGSSSYGVVIGAAMPTVNYFGCIQAVDPSDAGVSCAHALNAAVACADYACRPTCPVVDDVSLIAYNHCLENALSGACIEYSLPAKLCMDAEKGDGGTPVGSACFAGISALDHYLAMAHYFCGGG
jgi:hypothetical protein